MTLVKVAPDQKAPGSNAWVAYWRADNGNFQQVRFNITVGSTVEQATVYAEHHPPVWACQVYQTAGKLTAVSV